MTSDLERRHRFCGFCGAPMIKKETRDGFCRKSGKPRFRQHIECAKLQEWYVNLTYCSGDFLELCPHDWASIPFPSEKRD